MARAEVLVPTITDRIDAELIGKAGPQLRLIANFGNGTDNIDVAAAMKRGITVTNTPGVLTEDMADFTLAMMVAVSRRLVEGAKVIPSGQWQGWSPGWMLGRRIHGKRLGIIGMGRIGLAVARAPALLAAGALSQSPPGRETHRGRSSGNLLGFSRPHARADGYRLGALPAYARDLPPAFGASPEADEGGCLPHQHRAR